MPGGDHHLDPSEKTLAEYLNEIGYKTAVFGKWHLGSLREEYLPMSHGFDTFSGHIYGCIDYFQHSYGSYGDAWYIDGKPADEKGYSTDLITNHAIRFMEQRKKGRQEAFLSLSPVQRAALW